MRRQLLHAGGGREIGALVDDVLEEAVERLVGRVVAELGDALLHLGAEDGVVLVAPADADDGELVRQEIRLPEAVESGEELASRQVAGGAEDDGSEGLGEREASDEAIDLTGGRHRCPPWGRSTTGPGS